jgi:cystathionine beta-lyase
MSLADFDRLIDRRGRASVKWDLLGKLFGREDLLALWVADSDFPAPAAVVDALRWRADHPFYGYTFPPDSWYEAIQSWLRRRHGWEVECDWIIFSPGVVPALHLAVQTFTEPGTPVVFQPPVYGPFLQAITAAGRVPSPNPLVVTPTGYRIDFDHLAACLAGARLLLFCSPHNPVGRVWSADELRQLGDLCLRNGVTIVADEIHADLVFPEHRHTPLATLGPELAAATITCMSASKTFGLAGLVNAFLIIPDLGLRKRLLAAQSRVGMKLANLFGLTATEAALYYCGDWVDELRTYLAGNRAFLMEFLRAELPAISCVPPEGTYLAWLDCRNWELSPDELKAFLVDEARLALEDGRNFGPEGAGWQRLNFACPRSLLKQGLERLHAAACKRKLPTK